MGKYKIGAIVAVFAMLSACVPPRSSPLKNAKAIIDGSTGTEVFLTFDRQPSTGVAGSALGTQPKVALRDALGSTVAGSTMRITLTLYSDSDCTTPATTTPNGSASLSGTTAKNASFGSAVFSDVGVNLASTSLYMKAYAERVTTACSSVFTTTPGPVSAAESAISGATQVTSSSWTTITITAKDAYGNLEPTGVSSVAFTAVSGPGTGAFGSVTNAGAGVYTSNFTGHVAGLATLSGTINGSAMTDTHDITVIHGPTTHLLLGSIPASTTAGSAFNFTVTAKDAWENTCTAYTGTVAITSSDPIATLPASSSLTLGVGTFNVTLKTAGNQTITANDGTLNVTSSNILVNPSTATQLILTSIPVSTTACSSFNFTVTAKDAYNNVATGYGGTVAITSTDGAATLPSSSTLTSGTKSFNITLKTAGTQTITASDGTLNVTSSNITVNPDVASQLILTSIPASTTAGSQFSFTVTAKDVCNNVVPTYAGTVSITSSDGAATLPSSSTLTSGTKSFNITLKTAGNQTITASDGTLNVTSSNILVNPSTATQLLLTSVPASTTAGSQFSFTVTAKDAYNNVATGYGGTVAITSTDGAAILPSSSTLTSGTKSFDITLNTAGTQTITASDGTLNITSSNITVDPGTTTQLVLTSIPGSATAGNQFSFSVTAKDAYNNTTPAYAGTVAITSSDGAATLPSSSTLTSGTKSFNITLKTAATQTITASDGTLNVTSSNITVDPSTATQLVLTSIPASAISGSQFSFSVTAKDAYNNTTPAYAGTVGITSTDGAATLPSSSALTSGTKSFDITLNTAGTQTITASDGTLNVTSSNITVDPGPIADLFFTGTAGAGQPDATRTAGVSFTSIQVTAKDAAGNVTTNASDTVTIENDDVNCTADGTLGGTLTVALASGVATFTAINPQTAGTGYCLQAVTGGGIPNTTPSSTFDVTAGTQTQLIFTQQPSGANISTVIAPAITVAVADAYGNTVSSNKNITLAIFTNPGSSTLSGVLTQPAVAGVATFSDISLNNAGNGYVLSATCSSSPCLFTTNSAEFNILNTSPINVQTVVEMVDAGLSSGTSARKFTSTYTNLDPSYYDGTVTYTFEIVAKNSDLAAKTVTLNSRAMLTSGSCTSSTSSPTSVATISVPSGTSNLTRFTVSITAPASAKSYYISLPATTLANQVQVSAGRIVVTQTGAKKTRIYVPMVSGAENTYGSTSGSTIAADSTTSTSYTQGNPVRYYTWKKDVSRLINLAGANALTLESVMGSSTNGQANYASLFNTTSSTQITTSTPTSAPTSTAATFCTKTFNASDTGMTDNNDFEVKIKSGVGTSTAYLHKAGLWITLQGVTNLLTYNRLMRSSTVTGATTFEGNRMKLAAANYTSPTITYQCIATVSSSGITAVMSSDSTNDSGTASVATVINSSLSFSSSSKTKLESSSLSITDNNRFLPSFTGSGNITYGSCMAIISVN